jgi:hypothetical protein
VFPFDIASLLFPYFPPADCYLDYAEDGPGLYFRITGDMGIGLGQKVSGAAQPRFY